MCPVRHYRVLIAALILLTGVATSWDPALAATGKNARKTATETDSSQNSSTASNATANSDIRVLIDISGSMKKTDPQNLRVPAVKLLSQLLPENSRAGIWTFGQNTSELVPPGKVDKAWRKKALDKLSGITSDGIYTQIGMAMDRAGDDFHKLPTDKKTSVILLTDGMVDISRKPDENVAEKNRILDSVVKRYRKAGVPIHTIALSDQADKALMSTLASNTDGLAMQAENPEELMKLFNQIVNQETRPEQLPLDGNRFLVDSSIDEFTLLVFHHPQAAPTQLQGPDKTRYTAKISDPYVNWHADERYDLITLKQPLEGEWEVIAAKSPDNSVTVISNMKVKLAPLANNYDQGATPVIDVSFQQEGKPIEDENFFKVVAVDVDVSNNDSHNSWKSRLEHDRGHFRYTMPPLTEAGSYTIAVLIDGKTFERKLEHTFRVNAPAAAADAPPAVQPASAHENEHAAPAADSHAEASTAPQANPTHPQPDADTKHAEEPKTKTENPAHASTPAKADEHHDTQNDHTQKPDENGSKNDHGNTEEHAAASDAGTEEHAPENHETEEKKKTPWWIYAALAAGNLLLIGIGYFAWRFLMGNKKEDGEDDDSKDKKSEKADKDDKKKDKKH